LRSQQFKLAAIELERLVFIDPSDDQAKLQLIQAYRKSNDWNNGLKKIKTWYPDLNLEEELAREWTKLVLLNHQFDAGVDFIQGNSTLPDDERGFYQLAAHLLDEDFDQAAELLTQSTYSEQAINQPLIRHLETQQGYRYKKPGIALGLSALIPGLGKVYSKDWKDGLISLLFVATNTWQAYRGFSKDGIGSAYGWIFGTMAVGFYGSNLYGSWKSANDYNNRLNAALHHEIEDTVFSRF